MPAARSSASTRARVNFALTSVRISSPASKSTSSSNARRCTVCARVERSRISIHSRSVSNTATWSNASTSKSAASSRFITCSTFLLNSAVTPSSVVVGGDEPVGVLDEVGAEQEVIVRAEHRGDGGEERRARAGQQVPDRSAEEHDQPAAAGRDGLEVEREVADDGLHVDPRVFLFDRGGGVVQRALADVEGDESPQRSGVAHPVEQHARLLRGSGAELDEGVGPGGACDLERALVQDRPLAARRVVLLEPRDLVEQDRAPVVVEPLRRDVLRLGAQASLDVLFDRAHDSTSLARRTPPNIQRLAGERSFGR